MIAGPDQEGSMRGITSRRAAADPAATRISLPIQMGSVM